MSDDPKKLRATLDEALKLIDMQRYSIDEHKKALQNSQRELNTMYRNNKIGFLITIFFNVIFIIAVMLWWVLS